MERYVVCLYLLGSSLAAGLLPPKTSKTYRDDYVYIKNTDAFYKLHADGARYHKASKVCTVEGGSLVVIRSIQDVSAVHGLFKQFPDIGQYAWVGDDGDVHESAEEEALIKMEVESTEEDEWGQNCLVMSRDGEVESHNCLMSELPFVCKVEAAAASYDSACDVYAYGYEYKQAVGSCYAVPNITYTWNEAYAECAHQGAHLVVLNSEAEREAVQQIMGKTPYHKDSFSMYYYIAGIRAVVKADGSPGIFKTIFNQTLEEAGFAEWADTEPNNLNGHEFCGSLYESGGRYNDQDCTHAYAFICEKEISRNS